jgi:hypothetical protein
MYNILCIRTTLFLVITHLVDVSELYGSHLQGSFPEDWTGMFPRNVVKKLPLLDVYNAEERGFLLLRRGSLKSR